MCVWIVVCVWIFVCVWIVVCVCADVWKQQEEESEAGGH